MMQTRGWLTVDLQRQSFTSSPKHFCLTRHRYLCVKDSSLGGKGTVKSGEGTTQPFYTQI